MKPLRTTLLLLFLLASACGDGVFIIQVNTGTIASAPSCHDGAGQFSLLGQGGLVLLVVIDSDTTIFIAGGFAGTCSNLAAGAHVEVRGPQNGTTITAQSVRVT